MNEFKAGRTDILVVICCLVQLLRKLFSKCRHGGEWMASTFCWHPWARHSASKFSRTAAGPIVTGKDYWTSAHCYVKCVLLWHLGPLSQRVWVLSVRVHTNGRASNTVPGSTSDQPPFWWYSMGSWWEQSSPPLQVIYSWIRLFHCQSSRRILLKAQLSTEVSMSPKQTDPMIRADKNTEWSSVELKITVAQTLFGPGGDGSQAATSICSTCLSDD